MFRTTSLLYFDYIIRSDVLNKMNELPLTDCESDELIKVLDAFCLMTLSLSDAGKTLEGTIDFESLGVRLSYLLPGRRILQHFVKINKKDNENSVN